MVLVSSCGDSESAYNHDMRTETLIQTLRTPKIRSLFERNRVKASFLAGSYARGEQTESSDADIVFEKDESRPMTLMNLGNLKNELEKALGLDVDLVSRNSIREPFRESIENDMVLIGRYGKE